MSVSSFAARVAAATPVQEEAAPVAGTIGPTIVIKAGDLHNIASQAERALILAKVPFYVRGSTIMRPAIDRLPSSAGDLVKVARLVEVKEGGMIDYLSRAATWQKFDGRKQGLVPADPTPLVASTILSRDGNWQFPYLAGVITTPTLRPDGTILSTPGYDERTHLLLVEPPTLPGIPDEPTHADALNALAKLDALLDEFPFVDEASRSVALSALITPIVRGAMPVVPMHAISASTAGTGKSYIIDVVSAISAGEKAPVMSVGKTEEETEKRLGSAVMAGQPLISIDNVNGELGGDFLCQIIERPIVSPRVLGLSKIVRVESRGCCYATGNNLTLVGDMTRRVLVCSLDANMERPELREFKADPFATVIADRAEYIAAALTVVRAYIVAGSPNTLPALASFEVWSRTVRSALVWLGRVDPIVTMEKAREDDPVTSALTGLLTAWYAVIGNQAKPVGEIIATAELQDTFGNVPREVLRQALSAAASDKFGKISNTALGRYLARHAGRIVGGLKLVNSKDNHTKQAWWRVEKVG